MANNLCTKTVNMQPKPIKFLSKTEQSAAPESRVTAAEEECWERHLVIRDCRMSCKIRRPRRRQGGARQRRHYRWTLKAGPMVLESADPCRQQGGAHQRRGALALRQRPWTRAPQDKSQLTRAVPDESQLQEDTSKLAVGSAKGQAKSRFGQFRKQPLAVWAAGRGPDPSFTAIVF